MRASIATHRVVVWGLLAQSVEQRTFNPLVAGSNPAQPTTFAVISLLGLLAQSVEQRTFNPLVAGSNPAQPTTSFSTTAACFSSA